MKTPANGTAPTPPPALPVNVICNHCKELVARPPMQDQNGAAILNPTPEMIWTAFAIAMQLHMQQRHPVLFQIMTARASHFARAVALAQITTANDPMKAKIAAEVQSIKDHIEDKIEPPPNVIPIQTPPPGSPPV